MRNSMWLCLGVGLLGACNPPAVDPDAIFKVSATLQKADGTPASNITARIYKVDSLVQRENNFLQYPDVEDGLSSLWGSVDTYTTITDSAGAFTVELQGSEVNRDDGAGAAYLTVVHQDNGNEAASLATASDWHYFQDEDPEWDAGTLKLWDGGSGQQSGANIDITWASNAAPSGFEQTSDPYFVFVYPFNASDPLRWADIVDTTLSTTIPRAAFPENPPSNQAPVFFITGYSQEIGGSRAYQHRTSQKSIGSWSAITRSSLSVSLFEGALNQPFSSDDATDGSYDPAVNFHTFGADVEDFFIDLGATNTAFQEVMLFSLVLHNYGNADITLFSANMDNPGDGDWTQLGASVVGEWEFENWVYIGNTTGGTARWIRVNVDKKNSGGVRPFFRSITEVKVLQ